MKRRPAKRRAKIKMSQPTPRSACPAAGGAPHKSGCACTVRPGWSSLQIARHNDDLVVHERSKISDRAFWFSGCLKVTPAMSAFDPERKLLMD